MSLAAMAAGADGVMVEVHCQPCEAMCDKDQAMSPSLFQGMMKKLNLLKSALSKMNGKAVQGPEGDNA